MVFRIQCNDHIDIGTAPLKVLLASGIKAQQQEVKYTFLDFGLLDAGMIDLFSLIQTLQVLRVRLILLIHGIDQRLLLRCVECRGRSLLHTVQQPVYANGHYASTDKQYAKDD